MRRIRRRALEVVTQARADRLSPELAKAFQSSLIAAGAPPSVSHGVTPAGAAEWCTEELQKLVSARQSRAVHRWKVRMRSARGAFAWVRKAAPPPWAVRCPEQGVVEASSAGAVKLLEKWWGKLLCKDGCPPEEERLKAFAAEYPEAPTAERRRSAGQAVAEGEQAPEPVSGGEVRRCIKKMRGRAARPDGWAAALFEQLPDEATDELAEFLRDCENAGEWPEPLTHWRLVFLPKEAGAGVTDADRLRPISVGPLVYRIWACIRVQQGAQGIGEAFVAGQGGGRGTQDAMGLVLELQLGEGFVDRPFWASLDFAKAFDSIEVSVALEVLGLLGAQWRAQKRWIKYGGAVAQQPLQQVRALPPGCPWSPVAMSAIMAAAAASQRAAFSMVAQILDDRTLRARTAAELRQGLRAWKRFEKVTGMQEKVGKRQVWGSGGPP